MKLLTILIGVLLAFWLAIYIPIHGWHLDTGHGEHTGVVTAVERNGLFWKTGRAYVKTDISSSQEDTYCVIDPDVYSRLEQVSITRSRVTLQYRSYAIAGAKNCEGEQAVITGINLLK